MTTPGDRLMPLHIDRIGPHFVIYVVKLGGLDYYGSFTESEFIEWLNTNVEDRAKKHSAPSSLNIKLEL